MKHLLFSLCFGLIGLSHPCRAGIAVIDPPNSFVGGSFIVYYGLGTPLPGKIDQSGDGTGNAGSFAAE